MTDPFTNKEVREYVRDAESDISQLKARVKELEDLSHKQRALEAQLQGEINHLEAELHNALDLSGARKVRVKELEAEKAELRAELFCNQMCVRYWPSHHVECRLLANRLKRIKLQADDEGEA